MSHQFTRKAERSIRLLRVPATKESFFQHRKTTGCSIGRAPYYSTTCTPDSVSLNDGLFPLHRFPGSSRAYDKATSCPWNSCRHRTRWQDIICRLWTSMSRSVRAMHSRHAVRHRVVLQVVHRGIHWVASRRRETPRSAVLGHDVQSLA